MVVVSVVLATVGCGTNKSDNVDEFNNECINVYYYEGDTALYAKWVLE